MDVRHRTRGSVAVIVTPGAFVVALVLALAGCGGSPPSSTSTGAPCATHASATAMAWDADGQVQGSINGAAATTLSTFAYPLGLPGENASNGAQLGAIGIAPDGRHLAVAVDILHPQGVTSYPYIVDTATHVVTRVPLPRYPAFLQRESRVFAWADTHTLIVFAGIESGKGNGAAGTVFKYDLATGKASALAGIVNAVEGQVRCSTIFWIELTDLTSTGSTQQTYSYRGQAFLHRYSLATHAPIGAPIPLGDTSVNTGDSWVVDWPGWDVSGDGALVVYQQMAASFDGKQNNLTSTFKEANADGSGTRIVLAGPMTVMSSGPVHLAISPDGRQVALTTPASDIVSEPFVGAGVKAYSPPAAGLPAWLPNDSGFVATSHDPKSPAGVYQYWSGTPPLGPNGSIPGIELGEGGTNPASLF